ADVARIPRAAAVVGAVDASGRLRDEHAVGPLRVEHDRVQAEAAVARSPELAVGVLQVRRDRRPRVAAVLALEQARRLHAQEHAFRLVLSSGADLPDALQGEIPSLGKADRVLVLSGPGGTEIVGAAEGRPPEGAAGPRPEDGL